jgi:hypothetical protein
MTVVEDGSFTHAECYRVIMQIAKSFMDAGEEISKIVITWVNETEVLATPATYLSKILVHRPQELTVYVTSMTVDEQNFWRNWGRR